MIAVIADDLTGAAELAGISLRYGLSVEIFFGQVIPGDADVVIVCTDSRSVDITAAKRVTATAIENILPLKPSLVYKKIDSVLRGHVMEEVRVQMQLCGFEKVLILPSNPSLGRTIYNGEYFVDGQRINQTGFSGDPEFPIKSASVKDLIGDDAVLVLKSGDPLPASGISIGEAASGQDIVNWAAVTGGDCMLVGAGDFYTAILDKHFKVAPQAPVAMLSPHLYVCGTAFNERKKYIKTLSEKLDCVSYMPGAINAEWIDNTCTILREQQKLVIAIDQANNDAAGLRSSMAKAVSEIIKRGNIKEVFIEGGSTAAIVLEELGIQQLSPLNELQRGVVRMAAKNLFITVKPGSYELPAQIKTLYR